MKINLTLAARVWLSPHEYLGRHRVGQGEPAEPAELGEGGQMVLRPQHPIILSWSYYVTQSLVGEKVAWTQACWTLLSPLAHPVCFLGSSLQ